MSTCGQGSKDGMASGSTLPALRQLAAQLRAAGQPVLAAKALYACLKQSPVPVDEIAVSMQLARLLIEECVDSVTEAEQLLQHAVRTAGVGVGQLVELHRAPCMLLAPCTQCTWPRPPLHFSTWWPTSCPSSGC